MNTRPARPARQCPPRRLGGRSAVRSPPSSRTRGGPPILMPRGRPSTPCVRRHRGSRLYPRGQGSPGRRWLDHAVLVAGTDTAGGASRDDPIDTLRPVRRAALPHESQGSASARRSRAGLRSLHQGDPGHAICRRTEAVRIRLSRTLGPHLAATEVPAGEREGTVHRSVHERPRGRAQSTWRPLSSRMPNAWPARQVA